MVNTARDYEELSPAAAAPAAQQYDQQGKHHMVKAAAAAAAAAAVAAARAPVAAAASSNNRYASRLRPFDLPFKLGGLFASWLQQQQQQQQQQQLLLVTPQCKGSRPGSIFEAYHPVRRKIPYLKGTTPVGARKDGGARRMPGREGRRQTGRRINRQPST
ncbi:hypothetical protein Emag_002991 [Eimeria magna]